MGSSAKAEAALALHRFGMGPRPGSIAAIEADPRGALIAELERPSTSLAAASALPTSAKAFRAVNEANAKRQAKTILALLQRLLLPHDLLGNVGVRATPVDNFTVQAVYRFHSREE